MWKEEGEKRTREQENKRTMEKSELQLMVERNAERIAAIEKRLHRKGPAATDNSSIARLAKHFGFEYEEAMRFLSTGDSGEERQAKSPKAKSPKAKSPKAKSPKAKSPKAKSPKAKSPKAKSPTKSKVVATAKSPTAKSPTKPKVVAKSTVPLPWCGVAHAPTVCRGLRLNHGLYTQCTMTRVGGERLCKTCGKQAKANESGKPNYGLVEDRLEADAAQVPFKDPRGKSPTVYSSVMEKMNITREQAEAAAAALGWTIPETEYVVKAKGKRGRPSKKSVASVAAVADSDEEAVVQPQPKNGKRGRKSKKVMTTADVKDDVILGLIAAAEEAEQSAEEASESQAVVETSESPAVVAAKKGVEKRKVKAAEKKAAVEAEAELEAEQPVAQDQFGGTAPDEPLVSCGSESDEDELPVREFEIDGMTYLKAEDDILYDRETQEPIGVWNDATKAIDAFADDDDDDDM